MSVNFAQLSSVSAILFVPIPPYKHNAIKNKMYFLAVQWRTPGPDSNEVTKQVGGNPVDPRLLSLTKSEWPGAYEQQT
ncbi:uncharacterized protein ARMOST_00005 [Armillaria ostoyae]|uniref:Uncharacterized protein n=1 Tax=Armillaria ostoyae TaxID=47428 RepID=A0A284QJX4_ARMOS|nr:uncharacterized protein ARMOST_00005 [Armillaria ostoyae]